MKTLRLLAVVTAFISANAFAQDIETSEPVVRGQGWSMQSGKTLGAGALAISAQAGWPGLQLAVLKGVTPKVDFGGRFSFNYGFEGLVNFVVPGFKLQGLVRAALLERGKLNLGLEFAPGPLFYFGQTPSHYGTTVGLTLPFSLVAGIPVGSAIMLNFPLDIPMFVTFGGSGGLYFPVLVGAGVEYFIDSHLAATFKVRMGPTIDTRDNRRGNTSAYFTLETMIGVQYRL